MMNIHHGYRYIKYIYIYIYIYICMYIYALNKSKINPIHFYLICLLSMSPISVHTAMSVGGVEGVSGRVVWGGIMVMLLLRRGYQGSAAGELWDANTIYLTRRRTWPNKTRSAAHIGSCLNEQMNSGYTILHWVMAIATTQI